MAQDRDRWWVLANSKISIRVVTKTWGIALLAETF